MIKSISIRNYKSFHPSTPCVIPIDTQKPVALFYGLNGAGKSAIGEVIHGLATEEAKFADCIVTPTDGGPFRYLVYNHDFVRRVIGETMQGIFTIGEMDTAKQPQIDNIEAETIHFESGLVAARTRETAASRLVEDQKKRGIEEIWKAYELGKKSQLSHLLVGYGNSKEKFFNELRTHVVLESIELATLERLEARWNDASSTESEKSVPALHLSGLNQVESDLLWAEAIEVSTTSRLAALISELGNADWVDQGQPFVKSGMCPFCQENLPHDFTQELAKLLEGGRRLKIDHIDTLIANYEIGLEGLQEQMEGVFNDPITSGTGLELAWTKFESSAKQCLILMKLKQSKPSETVLIEAIDHQPLLDALNALKLKVDDFNQRIKDRKGEQIKIKKEFWQFLFANRRNAYATHDAALVPLNAQIQTVKTDVLAIQEKIAANRNALSELKKAQTGVDASVVQINNRLKDLGIESFWIKGKEGAGHLYCLARPNNPGCDAMSLSEGEKTLISFLYFMELIKGTHEEHGAADVSKTIVVVDDPISSLSQNYVYDIATIVHRELINPPVGVRRVRQSIVLTHNLFFFHELIRQIGGRLATAHIKCQMMRVHKVDYSGVVPLDPTQYMNDYDALWQVLKDARFNTGMARAVPNAMRCILEQFFAFTGKERDFERALKAMVDQDPSTKLKALQRYLDRGSHMDAINGVPMDWSIYDVDYYLARMRDLFKAVGNEDHYLHRMGEDEMESAGVAA